MKDTLRDVEMIKMVGGGRALSRPDHQVWLISGALPGERVRVREIRRRAGIIEAEAIDLLSDPHPARNDHPCPHAGNCGGCDWPHIDPESGSDLKIQSAAEAARTHPFLRDRILKAPLRTSPPAYRLRARLHWDPHEKILGFYGHRSRKISGISGCRILSPGLLENLPHLEKALTDRRAGIVDIEWLENLSGDRAVAALRRSAGGPDVVSRWIPEESGVGGLLQGFHVLRKATRLDAGWGTNSLVMELPIPLEVRIGSFFQGNRHLVPSLFQRVSDLCGKEPVPTWDLHGGVGFLGAAALWASRRPLVLSEPVRAAARCARTNLPDARVYVGMTAEELLRGWKRKDPNSLVLCDPPRAGLSPQLRKQLLRWKPQRILMLSCEPSTWARDTAVLTDGGWRLDHVELFDLFPSTHHVEILCTLNRDGPER